MNRKTIGLLFTFGKNWMGGVIYIQNLVKSLNRLSDEKKPNLIIFYNESSRPFLDSIVYPYILDRVEINEGNDNFKYLKSIIFRKNYFISDIVSNHKLDGLFPFQHWPVALSKKSVKAISWIPDLQHYYYPEYFSKLNLFTRNVWIKHLFQNTEHLVVSSKTVFDQIVSIYDKSKHLNISVLKFASIIDKDVLPKEEDIRNEFDIRVPYFVVSNQFWKHKDHTTVFKAIEVIKTKGLNYKVIFTGNMEDSRNSGYIDDLKNTLHDLDIKDYTDFVGLIDRNMQLALMKYSMAVIQPSLFEGWSTVVEDAKSLGSQIIASDLDVHLEQLDGGDKGFIFKQKDYNALSLIMLEFIEQQQKNKPIFDTYDDFISDYAQNFLNIFN